MKIDLHVHSCFSYDSATRPETILKWARLRGLDAVCITEHHSYLNSAPFAEWAERSRLLIFRGAEASTSLGHFLLFGVYDDCWNTFNQSGYIDPQRLIDYVNGRGGAVVAAHPFRRTDGHFGGWEVARLRGLAAIEVWNANCTEEENQEAKELARRMGLPGVGGSDAHVGAAVGMAYTELLQPVTGERQLVQLLKQGQCRAGR
ncbi:MAG: PHP domain-containing protein [Syntrophomonadaceae bacterium]|nr:PHP domain-containing protein [Syntrophomonadaceae bacterium]